MIRELDHIVLTATDLEASLRFYRDVLGMHEVRFGEGRVALRFGAQKINLHQAGAELETHAARPRPGSLDYCLRIEGDLESLHARLEERGVVFEAGPVDRTGAVGPIRSLYLRDPDGNLIELCEAIDPPLPALHALPLDRADGAVLRQATEEDAEACLAIYAPIIEQTHTSFETEIPSASEFRTRIAAILKGHDWLVIEREGVILGYAYSSAHRTRAAYSIACEVSVYVAEAAQGMGIARQLYEQVLARAAAAGKRQAYAIITLPNEASLAFHEALGFRPLAHFPGAGMKFGRLWDVAWWVRRLA